MTEFLLTMVGLIFGFSWLIKIILYAFFDRYEGMMRIGGLIMGTFMMYNKDEIEYEENEGAKTRMRINNICGYIMLAIVSAVVCVLLYIMFFR